MIDLLVVSAIDGELASLGVPLARTVERGSRRVLFCPVGIGPVAAAAGTAHRLARHEARAVVFVGTAGVLPSAEARFPLLSAAAARETALFDLAVARGVAEHPRPIDRVSFDATLTRGLGAPPASVATTVAVTVDAALAREIEAAGFELENLELAGVAAACARANVRCAAVLGVSNVVGPEGRAQWKANHAEAARAACAHLEALLAVPSISPPAC